MKQFAVSMDEETMQEFDKLIGDVPRSAYVRRLMINEMKLLKKSTPSLQLQPHD
jgi:metal-responsive CopG/Arc/MetJ family transcriptional regulator